MRRSIASLTATAVASARALATESGRAVVDPEDRIARALLPAPIATALSVLAGTALGRAVASPLLVRASLGMVDHVALRSALIDELLCDALSVDVRQVVIVGAGLDSRAHRLTALANAHVFEVDHPASQRAKRARAASLAIEARALSYVAVDLAKEPLPPPLNAAGFDPEQPCFVIVEGVLPYLKRAQVDDLLLQLSVLSARDSQLVLTYVPEDAAWLRHGRWLIAASLRAVGEPLGDLPMPHELVRRVSCHGFVVEREGTPTSFALARHGLAREPLVDYERMVLARRASSTPGLPSGLQT